MSFNEKKYIIVKSAISKELANFIYKYFYLKRKVVRFLFDKKYISPFRTEYGSWNDDQIPQTYSCYADLAMETLLEELVPMMRKETGLDLLPTYSYARIYKKGDVLVRHKDRFSCEVSTTINLGGDPWPIYLDTKAGLPVEGEYKSENNPGIKIDLDVGDMLIYSGCVLEHWREKFEGENCGQVFLHYTNKTSQGEKWKYDMRPFIGLPADFKKESH
jgi:hypothetical protein